MFLRTIFEKDQSEVFIEVRVISKSVFLNYPSKINVITKLNNRNNHDCKSNQCLK